MGEVVGVGLLAKRAERGASAGAGSYTYLPRA
ncbi:hypothetical protein FHY19_001548, partial [Xanthomonas arboricola]|nr:hypothetical protein [Xanthomonas sp. 4461]